MGYPTRRASRLHISAVLLVLSACTPPQNPVSINFASTWQGQPIECGDAQSHLSDLRFYVSDVVVFDSTSAEHDLQLTPDSRWQHANVALVDLENGEGACANGSNETRSKITGTTVATKITGFRFTVGIPFEQNHANPLIAEAPLNDAAMHWHWRSGYKFLRAGIEIEDSSFWVHLGSTGCQGTVQNITGCGAPNRVTVVLKEFSPDVDSVEISLSDLFMGVDFAGQKRGDCSSSPAEESCSTVFSSLGLPFGDQPEESQSVFRVLQ